MQDEAQQTTAELLAQAVGALRDGQLDAAERGLEAVLATSPSLPDALHFLGVLRHAQGRIDEAIALIRHSLDLLPLQVGAWNNLGNIYLLGSDLNEAMACYRHVIDADADAEATAQALSNLCTLYRRQGALDASEQAARQAIERQPEMGGAWYNLSRTLLEQGRIHDGLVANSRAITLLPQDVRTRQEVIRALMTLDERERAASLLREWLAEDPGNPVVEHLLAACGGGPAPERASEAYVAQVFDGFAASFDAQLEGLNYRAPEYVVACLAAALGKREAALDICDAGCGTGLCGQGLRPWAAYLAGCDLSAGMLRRAQARKIYDVLHQAELTYYLDTQPARFDVVVAADTLCYFGPLDGVFAAAARALRPGGWLVFTVEALDADAHTQCRLQLNGRYAHSPGHVRAALVSAGFEVMTTAPEILRQEAGLRVAGWVFSARRLSRS